MRWLLVLASTSVFACSPAASVDDAGPPPRDARLPPDAGREPIVRAERPPPPISGGTLAVWEDDDIVVVADPELDLVHLVDVNADADGVTTAIRRTIELERGAEPGRIAVRYAGTAHVALRRAGEILDVDLATGDVIGRRAVCAAPRGVAYEWETDSIHIACADGWLVTLPGAGGEATRWLWLGEDLRDVVSIPPDGLLVTRFRSAETIHVLPSGAVANVVTLPGASSLAPAVMWRAVPNAGGALVVHQLAARGTIDPHVGYGSLVETWVTGVHATGATSPWGALLVPLGVDISVARHEVAVPSPASSLDCEGGCRRETTAVVRRARIEVGEDGVPRIGLFDARRVEPGPGTAIAVAHVPHVPQDLLAVQTRAPSTLLLLDADDHVVSSTRLSDVDTFDSGHALFHAPTPGRVLACASCHPEGGDDGRTWVFSDVGPRRTQSIRGGVLATAPFHWGGDLEDFEALVREVLEDRMGGSASPGEIDALAAWVDAIPALPPPLPADAASAERGRAIFHDPASRCTECHAGALLTRRESADVGTGAVVQVPSLRGLAYRAPYLHTGCAATLQARFEESCGGGDAHGVTSTLTPEQIGDLVAYLRTL